jgi:ABC-type transport system substrate-binding protein
MISPAALEKYGKEIGFHPVGTGPYELDTWNQTDFVKVKKFVWKGKSRSSLIRTANRAIAALAVCLARTR